MGKKPPPQYFSAAATFLEDKCLDFTDCGLGIFCKSYGFNPFITHNLSFIITENDIQTIK
jgi:hypothetical protein